MTLRTVTRMFDTHQHALEAVRALEASGFSHDDVSIVAGNADGRHVSDLPGDAATTDHAVDHDHVVDPDAAKSGAGIGATLGTVLGGGAGLAAGLGALAIPGIGPIVAAGWLIAALAGAGAGAAAGGALGSLTGAGVDEAEAPVFAEGVRRGGSLVVVRAPEARMVEAEAILQQHNPVDLKSREADYRAGGWDGYEENVVPSQATRPVPPVERL